MKFASLQNEPKRTQTKSVFEGCQVEVRPGTPQSMNPSIHQSAGHALLNAGHHSNFFNFMHSLNSFAVMKKYSALWALKMNLL
jgi:hypothetical protein